MASKDLTERKQSVYDIIKADLKNDSTTGAIDNGDGKDTVYTKTLEVSDLTADQAKRVHEHDMIFIAAGARVVTEMQRESFTATPELNTLTHTLPMDGKDTVSYTLDRTGGLVISQTSHSTNVKAGDLKKLDAEVREWIKSGKTEKAEA